MSAARVMVVEDSPTQMVRLQLTLEAEGFEVICAASAEKALEMFGGARPDLVIVDYHLPGIQGDELCRQLRMNIDSQSIPILMLTIDQTAAAELHSLESGADDYVSKSEDADILMLRVHALRRKARERSAILNSDMPVYYRARILVVDDSPTYLEFLAEELGREGYLVETAASAAEGMALAGAAAFDCVLVDLVMPDTDGVALCKLLTETRSPTDLPGVVLMLSAHETKDNVTRALGAGADDFVGKSSDMAVIKARVRALLRRKFVLEQNRRIIDEFKAKEIDVVRARAEKEAAEAKAALAEELRHANTELERANRKLRDAQSQLVHSEKMASLGQLVAGIAHEINNPLSFVLSHVYSVAGWLERVLREDGAALSEASRERLSKAGSRIGDMDQGLQRVKNLVVKLRTFSRLDEDEFSSADIPEAIESVLLLLNHRLEDRIAVVRDYGPLASLSCRAGQINQVLMNILANAIDAIEGTGTITVTTACDDDVFSISVADSGRGMSEVVKRRIFDPFFTTKPVGEGTGLGMSISYGIVDAHGGSISFDSDEEAGTTVTVRIPRHLGERRGPVAGSGDRS